MKSMRLPGNRNITVKPVEVTNEIDLSLLEKQMILECRLSIAPCKTGEDLTLEIRPSSERIWYHEAKFRTAGKSTTEDSEKLPGFYVADAETDLTLDKIIKRATDYLTTQIEKLGKIHINFQNYEIEKITISNAEQTEEGTLADVDAEITQYEEIPVLNFQKTWKQGFLPEITSESKSIGQKAKTLLALQRSIANSEYKEQTRDIAENMQALLLTLINAYNRPEIYRTKEEYSGYTTFSAEIKDAKLQDAVRHTAVNLHENIFLNPDYIRSLALHELLKKFDSGKPCRISLKKQKILYD